MTDLTWALAFRTQAAVIRVEWEGVYPNPSSVSFETGLTPEQAMLFVAVVSIVSVVSIAFFLVLLRGDPDGGRRLRVHVRRIWLGFFELYAALAAIVLALFVLSVPALYILEWLTVVEAAGAILCGIVSVPLVWAARPFGTDLFNQRSTHPTALNTNE
jgi:hypothetical protein